MLTMIIMLILPIMILSILIIINLSFSMKSMINKETPSPFECGFNPITSPQTPYSNQFFIIMIIFLIFDMEFILLMMIIPMMKFFNPLQWFKTLLTIMIILIIGTIYEYNNQSVSWMN
uniref:NADH-ubiquinone oxidoreductase chain 3 n=1 Tax=Orancistrocerus aterrimus TaxID=2485977 RepID=A0A3G3FWD5_9HYME|nr:NADH dehydrogenase subunit 3 [Orancistrocerus aterrimus]AYQ18925.1 NADH dehydrogenase subunit 3 [Orancistrocerus aterrimus]